MGIYYDQSGNGNNWTATDVVDSTNWLNNVMSFNGSSSYVDLWNSLNSVFTNSFNISFNINKTSTNTSYIDTLFSNRYSNLTWFSFYTAWALGWQPWEIWIEIANTSSDRTSYSFNKIIENGKYYHISLNYTYVWVWSVNTLSLFVNWERVFTSNTVKNIPSTSNILYLWRDWYNNAYRIIWDISSIKIYNKALSETEIQQLYYSSYIN